MSCGESIKHDQTEAWLLAAFGRGRYGHADAAVDWWRLIRAAQSESETKSACVVCRSMQSLPPDVLTSGDPARLDYWLLRLLSGLVVPSDFLSSDLSVLLQRSLLPRVFPTFKQEEFGLDRNIKNICFKCLSSVCYGKTSMKYYTATALVAACIISYLVRDSWSL